MSDMPESAAKSPAELRRQRQAAALRTNLRKRKDQARGKGDAADKPAKADHDQKDS